MNKINLTEEKLNKLKKQTKDKFTYFLIEDLRKKLLLKDYTEIYKKLDFDRILNLIKKEETRKKLKAGKFINFNQIFDLKVVKRSGQRRNLSIGGGASLRELSHLMQREFDLEPGHLYEFRIGGFNFGPECDEWQETFDELDNFKMGAAINSASLSKGDSFKFLYDFGDNIKFKIEILDIKNDTRTIYQRRTGKNR